MKKKYLILLVGSILFTPFLQAQDPPFGGTIFLDPDIITEEDSTTFIQLTAAGQAITTMYDRRNGGAWVTRNAYLFNASYNDGLQLEIQVNPEFSEEAAKKEAEKYAPIIGRLPTAIRKDGETVWIHKGVNPFGGGNNNFLIHTGQADLYEADGILEETLVHEGSHTSLDDPHASTTGWLAAQQADPTFISTYARDNPNREDIAESFLLYLAIRHRADRIDASLKNTIEQTMPNRIAYFDEQNFDLFPITTPTTFVKSITSEIKVYPSFVRDYFKIEMEGEAQLSIFNLSGQLMRQEKIYGATQIEIPAWPSGLYFLTIDNGTEWTSGKFVKE